MVEWEGGGGSAVGVDGRTVYEADVEGRVDGVETDGALRLQA